MTSEERPLRLLAVFVAAVSAFVLLFLLRFADDNRLTSWLWVFDRVDAAPVYAALSIGCLAALAASRFPLPGGPGLFVIALLSGVLFWREPEAIVDASRYFIQAKHLEVYGIRYFVREWGGAIAPWTDLPLVPFLYGLLFKFLGESRHFIQGLNTVFFSLSVVLTYGIGKGLWDKETGRLAGLMLLSMPYVFSQVPLMLVDVASMFFLVLSIFTLDRALTRGGAANMVISSAAMACAFFVKYSTWPMTSVLVLLFLSRRYEAKAEGRSLVFARGMRAFILAAVLSAPALYYWRDVVAGQIGLLMEYQRPGLARWTEGFASTFLFQIHPFVTASAALSVYAALRKRDPKYLVVSFLLALAIVMQVRRIRYLIPVFPLLSLMAAYGLMRLRGERLRRAVALCAFASSLAVSAFGYLPFLDGLSARNLRDAGAFLDSLGVDKVRVYAVSGDSAVNPAVAVPLLDLFTSSEIVFDYDEASPRPEGYEESPLRFTWDYKNPHFYASFPDGGAEEAAAVIYGSGEGARSEGHGRNLAGFRLARDFDRYEGVFRFRSFVSVYVKG